MLMAITAIREALEAGEGPASVSAFVTQLADGLTERMDKVVLDLADEVDDLEDQSLDGGHEMRGDVAELRRTTIMLRRYIAPQREVLSRLGSLGTKIFDEDGRISLRESTDRITRIVEELDAVRERAAILYDQIADRRAEQMNRHMMVLSVVAAVFLPLGFLTGLLGINVGGIPMADSPYGFAVVVGLSALIGGGLVWFFRRLDWI